MVKQVDYRIVVNDVDLTEELKRLLVGITIVDNANEDSDQLTIQLSSKFQRPAYGDKIKVYLGWLGMPLSYMGFFVVQTTRVTDNTNLAVSATGVDFSGELKQRRVVVYDGNIKTVVNSIASRHGLKVSCNLSFGYRFEQSNESDISFLNRLAKKHSVVFNIKNQTLYFTDSTVALSPVKIDINKCISSDIEHSNSTSYASCKAIYHNTQDNTIHTVQTSSAKPSHVIKGKWLNDSDALEDAKAALKRANRGVATGTLSMPGVVVYAGSPLVIDSLKYLSTKVTHEVSESWTTSIDFKSV